MKKMLVRHLKHKYKLGLTLGLILSSFLGIAQQDAQYSMYFFNGLYINPAYAGSKEVIDITAIYRHQWAGIQGAPRSASVGVNSPFRKDQNNIGVLLSTDHIGVTNTISLTAGYAYKVKFTKDFKLNIWCLAAELEGLGPAPLRRSLCSQCELVRGGWTLAGT